MSEPVPTPPPRPVVLGLAALTVLAVGALSLVLFRDDIERVDADAVPEAVDPTLVADDFDRPDAASLADASHPWVDAAGAWAVRDGHAALIEPAADGPSLALLPGDTAGTVARATVTAVEPGWGFAFRVHDEDDFWAVVARPDSASWSLVLVEEGVVTETPDVVARPPADGARIEVRLAGDLITVTVDGVSGEVRDGSLADATGLGLVALSPDHVASMAWDDVSLDRR